MRIVHEIHVSVVKLTFCIRSVLTGFFVHNLLNTFSLADILVTVAIRVIFGVFDDFKVAGEKNGYSENNSICKHRVSV